MTHPKLYERVAMAYTDFEIDPDYQLQIFDDPQQTIDHTELVLEFARKRLEQIEWQATYYNGEAIHQELMKNPGDTYLMAGERLGLTKHQVIIGVRIYKLFRDHFYTISKFSGMTQRDLSHIPINKFDKTLHALHRDYPPVMLPEENEEEVEFD